MSVSKSFSPRLTCALLLWLCGVGIALGFVSESHPENSSVTFWQRVKASFSDFQWQQTQPEVETPETIQKRREIWQRLTMARIL
ncbi:uncharacterized protein LOC6583273 [Drosophila mojavensis]|uniref:Uncharacterized protein n=1 Tax=Drosophila mojavensis TaxID=7230 RepID=B4KV82_DROMO|nr:uncharacterized protein LOC6583273 [Drosophila mojavensis]EDW19422.1 uncharacterized protein Dmoj_GI11527 [Drosophila mojavensis]